MDNYYNISLYGNTQDDITSSQCSAQDFMLTQNSYDLSRYTKDIQINNNSKSLEIIKEEDIFSQAEQLFFENEKTSLQKQTYVDQNLNNNANNKANQNKSANNINNNNSSAINSNSFGNDTSGKNNFGPNKQSNNTNIDANTKSSNNTGNFKVNNLSVPVANIDNNLIDEKIFLISQEIDKIEMQHKEDSLKKLNLAPNNNNANYKNNIGNGKNQNNFANTNKNQITSSNNNNNLNSTGNNNPMKLNSSNQNANNAPNFTNNTNLKNNQKSNKVNNDFHQADATLNLQAKSDFNTEKKQSMQKNNFYDGSINLNNASEGIADELNQELYGKIKSVTDNFLTEFDVFSNKIRSALDNYKRVFLSDVNALYRVLKEETFYIVSEEEKNRIIDEKIKIIFSEMMGVFNQISP